MRNYKIAYIAIVGIAIAYYIGDFLVFILKSNEILKLFQSDLYPIPFTATIIIYWLYFTIAYFRRKTLRDFSIPVQYYSFVIVDPFVLYLIIIARPLPASYAVLPGIDMIVIAILIVRSNHLIRSWYKLPKK